MHHEPELGAGLGAAVFPRKMENVDFGVGLEQVQL